MKTGILGKNGKIRIRIANNLYYPEVRVIRKKFYEFGDSLTYRGIELTSYDYEIMESDVDFIIESAERVKIQEILKQTGFVDFLKQNNKLKFCRIYIKLNSPLAGYILSYYERADFVKSLCEEFHVPFRVCTIDSKPEMVDESFYVYEHPEIKNGFPQYKPESTLVDAFITNYLKRDASK